MSDQVGDVLDETRIGDPSLVTGSAPKAPRRLGRGESLGRYVMLDVLGEGGMGTVYGAYDPELDRKLALKVLRPRKKDLDLATARLRREAQAMAKLAHPNVVAVHDIGTHHDQLWVAMDFVEGETLRDWMNKEAHAFDDAWPLFRAAGLGLAAAHAAGLVHRDFKPANVLIGNDGRVQVADFGLARLDDEQTQPRVESDESDAEAAPTDDEQVARPARLTVKSNISLSSRVTRTGAFLGTPAYMAPEQFAGGEVDGRSDQFAFAVAMWEALCGERPFAGGNPNTVMFNVVQGKLREPPRGVDMPRRVRTALTRALSQDKADRYADMGELIAALEPPKRRWLWPSIAVGAAAVAAGVSFSVPDKGPPPPVCAERDPQVAEVWSPQRRAQLEAVFAEVDAPWASEVGAASLDAIDRWVPRYHRARLDACEATRVTGEQSERLMDLRMLCLDRRVRRLDALVSVLQDADPKLLRRSESMVRELDDLEQCADRETLEARTPPPADPTQRAELARIEGAVEKVWTLRRAGKTEAAFELANETLVAADQLDFDPARAEIRFELGRVLGEREDEKGSAARLTEAFHLALRSGDDKLAARAAAAMVSSMDEQKLPEQEQLWFDLSESILERAGGSDGIRAALLTNRGNAVRDRGDYAEAVALHERAESLYAKQYGERSMFRADATYNASGPLWDMGEPEKAKQKVKLALEIWREHVGESHPRITSAMGALAIFELQSGNDVEAIRMQERVIERLESEKGPESMAMASALSNLGAIATEGEENARAAEALERAASIYEGKDKGDSVGMAYVQGNLAKVQSRLGKHDSALQAADRALSIMRKAHPEAHTDVATGLVMRGEVHLGRKDFAAARADFFAAIENFSAAVGPDFLGLAEIYLHLARLELQAGRIDAAAKFVAEADRIASDEDIGPLDRGELELVRYEIARARKQPERAEQAWRDARDAFVKAGKAGAKRLAELPQVP